MIVSAFTVLWLASLVVVVASLMRLTLQTLVGGWLLLTDRRGPGAPMARALRPAGRARIAWPVRRRPPSRPHTADSRAVA